MVESSYPVSLSAAVERAVEDYLSTMQGEEIRDLYELLLSEVEPALLKQVLAHTNDNQSATAVILGLNRGTLRKKLRKYGLL